MNRRVISGKREEKKVRRQKGDVQGLRERKREKRKERRTDVMKK